MKRDTVFSSKFSFIVFCILELTVHFGRNVYIETFVVAQINENVTIVENNRKYNPQLHENIIKST